MGAYDLPDYEWGTASSPILYRDLAIVQCDQQKGSFLTALDRRTGKTVWRTERDELPSWGTPTIYPGKTRAELVTNAANFIRGYDPLTGKELWRLGGSSKITAPTPIYAGDLILVSSGRRPEAPLFAIRAGAAGDITLATEQTQNRAVAWSKMQRGPYMPTPLFYRGMLYVLGNAGIFDAYDFKTGREIYRQRIPHQGSGFSASPVVSDGKIYLASEDGDIFVVGAGERFRAVEDELDERAGDGNARDFRRHADRPHAAPSLRNPAEVAARTAYSTAPCPRPKPPAGSPDRASGLALFWADERPSTRAR